MIIALDAMGGDFAPENEVLGALQFLRDFPEHKIILVGDEKKITAALSHQKVPSNISIKHTDVHVTMKDSPTAVLREKKDSSMAMGLELHKNAEADAFVSTGNTGAQLAFSGMILKRIKGVNRPGIGAFIPNHSGFTLLMDVGANVDCKALNLYQYAVMSDIMSRHMYKIEKPTLGLLNIGEEESKGNDLSTETYQLLKADPKLNFVGNIEGRDILNGKYDIIICDGFVGNITLKLFESILPFLKTNLTMAAKSNPFSLFGALFMKPAFKKLKSVYDYQVYGGVPLLGVNGISIICHGSSSPFAIKNALSQAVRMKNADINLKIEQELNS